MLELSQDAVTFGGLNEVRSASVSRTIMVPELALLLDTVERDAGKDAYLHATVDENALLKPTRESRTKSYSCLRDRYALDPNVPLFGVLRRLASWEPETLPQLAILVAAMRDPLIRTTFPLMLERQPGEPITTPDFYAGISAVFSDRFSAATMTAASERLRASWHQSGHLTGSSRRRVRANPPVTPATIAMGLIIGDACGIGGSALLKSSWIQIQGVAPSVARDHALTAAGRGWIELREGGGILDISFRGLLTPEARTR